MHRSRLDLGQTKLAARFNESGQQPITTLSARLVTLALGCEIETETGL